jgi:hypothetical protein
MPAPSVQLRRTGTSQWLPITTTEYLEKGYANICLVEPVYLLEGDLEQVKIAATDTRT